MNGWAWIAVSVAAAYLLAAWYVYLEMKQARFDESVNQALELARARHPSGSVCPHCQDKVRGPFAEHLCQT